MKTLRKQIKKDLKKTLYKNPIYMDTRWNHIEKRIIAWSTDYRYYCLNFFLRFVTLTYFLIILLDTKNIYFNSDFFKNWKQLMQWQDIILACQLTIIAILYPLVVGFISVLFQDKTAKTIIFPVYKKYSGFMFAGLSGLTLSIFIIIGIFLSSFLSDINYLAFCISSAIWFSFNLILTAWFFTKTFKILNDESRNEIITRFSIQEACVADISKRNSMKIIQNAKDLKILFEKDKNILSVETYSFSNEDFIDIFKKVKVKNKLVDVNYSIINFAIIFQTYILKLKKIDNCIIIISPLSKDRKTYVLAKYQGFKVNLITKLLIKIAFKFNNIQPLENDQILLKNFDSFIQPAYEALRDNNLKGFEQAIDNLLNYHDTISESLSFIKNDSTPDNWLLLSDGSFWGRSYLNDILREYYQIAKDAIDKMPNNNGYYKEVLGLHRMVFSSRKNITSTEAVQLIQGGYYLWEILLEWRSFENIESLRANSSYKDIIYDFVSSWEGWPQYSIEYKSKRSYDTDNVLLSFLTHLKFTSATSIAAIRFNNFDAAGWGVDMLNHWLEHLGTKDYYNEEYEWKSVLINHTILKLDSNHYIWKEILNCEKYNVEAAYDLALKNAHIDLRVLCACYLLIKPLQEGDVTLKQYVLSLLSGQRIHPSNDLYSVNSISNAGELLGTYIRQRDYAMYGGESYGAWLSSVLEYYGQIFRDRVVAGRIYSGWGANNIKSLDNAFIEIALSLSQKEWGLPREWYEVLNSNYYKEKNFESLIHDLNDWVLKVEDIEDIILFESEDLDCLKENFLKSINRVILEIKKISDDSIVNAPIDENRLNEMSLIASSVFNEENLSFPMCLFEIEKKQGFDTALSVELSFRKYQKKYISKGIETIRASNEDSAIQEEISNNLKLNIFREILKYPIQSTRQFNSLENTILGLLSEIRAINRPILFVGNHELKNQLRKLRYQQQNNNFEFIKFKENFGNRYICHIGQCEVYSLPFTDVDYCLLTSKNLFEKIIYHEMDDNKYVIVEYLVDENNKLVGSLNFKYKVDVVLSKSVSVFKFNFIDN